MKSKIYIAALFHFLIVVECSAESSKNTDMGADKTVVTIISSIKKQYSAPEPNHDIPFTSGDYNGDGVLDVAFIAIAKGAEFWALHVYFGAEDGQGNFLSIDEHSPSTSMEETHIHTSKPGKYKTTCSYFKEGCPEGKPSVIDIQNDGINLVILEASSSIIYLDPATNKFVRLWLSD